MRMALDLHYRPPLMQVQQRVHRREGPRQQVGVRDRPCTLRRLAPGYVCDPEDTLQALVRPVPHSVIACTPAQVGQLELPPGFTACACVCLQVHRVTDSTAPDSIICVAC